MRLADEKRRRWPLLLVAAVLVVGFFLLEDRLPEIDLERILQDVAEGLGDWTYALVGVFAFLETGAFVGLVAPGETVVILGGAVAGQGEISVVLLIGIVWVAAWAGDSVSFLIGRKLGRGFILRHGPRVRITHERFAQVEDYFSSHGGKTILVGRFIGLVRALAPFVAGSSGMRYRAFLPFSVLGTGLWGATFSLLGFFLSESIERAGEIAGRGTLVFGIAVAAVVGVVLAVRFLRDAEKRAGLVAAMEGNRATRPLLELLRRFEPQARFVWDRLTPGGLGLEFTAIVAALAVSLYVLILYWVILTGDPGPTPGDSTALEVARDLEAGWLTDVQEVITDFGGLGVALPVAALAAFGFVAYRRWAELAVLAVALGLVIYLVPDIKDVVERPRPAGSLHTLEDTGYPSGHAAMAMLYPWLALVLAWRLRPGMFWRTALIVAGIALAVAIGLSRVYLRVHFLSDASGGWALGVAAFSLCGAVAMVVTHFRDNGPSR